MTKNSIVIETQDLNKSLAVSNPVASSENSKESLQILQGINLHVSQAESVAITGISGSGKTTLLGLLAGLDVPSSGEVRLLDQNLSTLDEDQRAALRLGKVGFVFQSFHLMDNLTAHENVMLPLELDSNLSLKNDGIRERATKALKEVGLEHRMSHLPTQLSGGEQQRVALARAFVSNPLVLFADEPTGNLDSNTGREIVELLFKMQQQNSTTLVLVTHDDALADQCQTHYRIDAGRIMNTRQDTLDVSLHNKSQDIPS